MENKHNVHALASTPVSASNVSDGRNVENKHNVYALDSTPVMVLKVSDVENKHMSMLLSELQLLH